MNKLDFIRQFYAPLQPLILPAESGVVYSEYRPSPALQPYIYCYWHLKTTKQLEAEFSYRVVADGCIDIFFELQSPEENFVMGFCKKHTEFPLGNAFNYAGIRFLPGMFPLLFPVNAAELSGKFEELNAVHPETARFLAGRFHPDQTAEQVNELLDQYFLSRLSRIRADNDPRLSNAIASILENKGLLRVEKDIHSGISPRQLRRLFQQYVGDTPKTFSKVIRFQHFLRTRQLAPGQADNKLFYDTGYYDQPHFIKEFRNFYGATPGRAFHD